MDLLNVLPITLLMDQSLKNVFLSQVHFVSINMDSLDINAVILDISNGFNIFNFNDLMNVNLTLSSAEVAIGETMSMTCGTSFERESNLDWYINGKLIEGSEGKFVCFI